METTWVLVVRGIWQERKESEEGFGLIPRLGLPEPSEGNDVGTRAFGMGGRYVKP